MTRFRLTYCMAVLVVLSGLTPAASAMTLGEKSFYDGNEAYLQTNFSRAVRCYEKALQYGYDPGALYFNLGNANYRQGKLGNAIAAYRRAQAQLPRDEDVRANLATARSQASDGLTPRPPSAAVRSFLFLYYYVSMNELLWLSGMLFACVFALLAVYAFVPAPLLRQLVYAGVVVALLCATAAGVHLYYHTVRPDGVVLAEEALVRNAPSDSAVEMFALHAGTEFAVPEQRADWVKIDIDGKKGWIKREDVEVL